MIIDNYEVEHLILKTGDIGLKVRGVGDEIWKRVMHRLIKCDIIHTVISEDLIVALYKNKSYI